MFGGLSGYFELWLLVYDCVFWWLVGLIVFFEVLLLLILWCFNGGDWCWLWLCVW